MLVNGDSYVHSHAAVMTLAFGALKLSFELWSGIGEEL